MEACLRLQLSAHVLDCAALAVRRRQKQTKLRCAARGGGPVRVLLTLSGSRSILSLLLLGLLRRFDGGHLGVVLLLQGVPLLPVVQQAVQHGGDLHVETAELLRRIWSEELVSGTRTSRVLFVCRSDLVDERADEVDETTLQLRQLLRLVPVHHGLEGEEVRGH